MMFGVLPRHPEDLGSLIQGVWFIGQLSIYTPSLMLERGAVISSVWENATRTDFYQVKGGLMDGEVGESIDSNQYIILYINIVQTVANRDPALVLVFFPCRRISLLQSFISMKTYVLWFLMEMLVLPFYKETGKMHNYFTCAIRRKWCEVNPLGKMVWEKSCLYLMLCVLGDDLENSTWLVLQGFSIGALKRMVAQATCL